MKDFEFAKRLCEYRIAQGLSQKELAAAVGSSNKVISKWENAESLPGIVHAVRLAKVFNITVDELVGVKQDLKKVIKKIAVTGGPCSGKSTAMSWIQTEFTKKGYMVLFIPESATELILGGVAPWTIDTNFDFQSYIINLQLQKEALFEEAARHVENYDKVLIVCDRGVMDCKAYMSELEFKNALKAIGKNEIGLRDSYDAVFHLVSASIGAEDFYNHETNKARYEDIDEARKKDASTLSAWMGHPHLRVVDNSTGFEEKMRRLMAEISAFLGEPKPYEIERKFLIEKPNLDKLEKLENAKRVEIVQTYLKSAADGEIRIRQRGSGNYFTYTKTIKKNISDIKRLEMETRISKDEYLKLLLEADPDRKQIRKTRYCLMHKNLYFEIDIFPQWKDKAIMELELVDENQKIDFPEIVKVIKEVTGEKEYSNYYLSKK